MDHQKDGVVQNAKAKHELGLCASNAPPSINVADDNSHDNRPAPTESSRHVTFLKITDTAIPSCTLSTLKMRISNRKRPQTTGRRTKTGSMIPLEGLSNGRVLTEPKANHKDGCLPTIKLSGTRENETSTIRPTRTEGQPENSTEDVSCKESCPSARDANPKEVNSAPDVKKVRMDLHPLISPENVVNQLLMITEDKEGNDFTDRVTVDGEYYDKGSLAECLEIHDITSLQDDVSSEIE